MTDERADTSSPADVDRARELAGLLDRIQSDPGGKLDRILEELDAIRSILDDVAARLAGLEGEVTMFLSGRPLYYDRKGLPMDMTAWSWQHEDYDYRTVAQHWVRGWMVSTIWLGIDHNFTFEGPPVIFETMVFPPGDEAGESGVMSEEYCERYATEEAAQAGHDRALSWVVEKIGEPAAAMEIMLPAQFGDTATVPDDPGDLT